MLKQILSTHNRRYHAEQSVRYGPPAREIEAEAEDWGADLIILGAGEKKPARTARRPLCQQSSCKSGQVRRNDTAAQYF